MPELRFPEFTDEWKQYKLSDLFSKITKKNSDNSITNVISNSAKNGLIPQRDYFDKDIANSNNTSSYYVINENDFVYNPRKSNEAPYGPVSVYKYKDTGIVSPLYLCFTNTKELNVNYMDQFFKSSYWHRYIYESGDSGARHDRVSIRDDVFFNMPIFLPKIEEQNLIAKILFLLDNKISRQQELLDNLKLYKRGLLKQVFKSKHEWKEVLLGNIADIYQPQTISSDMLNPTSQYAVYGANGQIGNYDKYNHETEQIAICCRGASCGTVNYIPALSWITGNAMVINTDKYDVNKKFLFHQLSNADLSYMISGSGQPQIVRTPCELHKMYIPNKELQLKISSLLDSFDTKIEMAQDTLTLLQQTKLVLLQKMFI